jgi:hypothetical protein
MYCIVDGHQNGNVMKYVNAFVNELMRLWANLNFKLNLITILRMMVINSLWIDLSFDMKFLNKTKVKKPIFMNIFQPWLKIIQQCYNNLQK